MKIEKLKGRLVTAIPDDLAADLNLREGDEVVASKGDDNQLVIRKAPDLHEALVALRRLRGRMPADFKFDREEANARR